MEHGDEVGEIAMHDGFLSPFSWFLSTCFHAVYTLFTDLVTSVVVELRSKDFTF